MCSKAVQVSDVISYLQEKVPIKHLVKIGLISSKHANFYEINKRYQQLCASRPELNRVYNAEEVASEFNVTIRTVFRAHSTMKQQLFTD